MGGRRGIVLVATAAMVAPLAGWNSLPASAADNSRAAPTAVKTLSSTCFPQDNGDPVLKTFEFSPRDVDSRHGAQTVTFAVRAEDTGGPGAPSGVAYGTVYVSLDDLGGGGLQASLKPDGNGAMVGTLTILPQYETATWYLSLILEDAVANSSYYSTSHLAQLGFPTTFTTTTTPDVARPVLRSLDVSATTIDTRRHKQNVRIRLHATDDSAVAMIRVFLYGSTVRASTAHPRLVAGTTSDGTWAGHIRVPRWGRNSTAKIAVELTDVVGRFRLYDAKKLVAIGQQDRIRIVSRQDPEPPVLRLRSMTPDSVDLRAGAKSVTFSVRVKDAGSGARKVALRLDGPASAYGHRGIRARFMRVSGTSRNGVWRARVTLPPCGAVAGPWRATVVARDASKRNYIQVERAVQVVNTDILMPTATMPGNPYQLPQSGPVNIQFDEDVVGVVSENALVIVGYSHREEAGDDPTPIVGRWACKNAAGAVVDCLAGPVRTAAFTPDTPLLPGTEHTVEFNPEHHLGLTDLAGNPFPPRNAMSFQTA